MQPPLPSPVSMTPAHLDAVLAIERQAFVRPWSEAAFLAELARDDAFNLIVPPPRTDAPPPGYLSFRIAFGEMQIMRIAVAEGAKRRGIASSLMAHALDRGYARAADDCFLETGASNAPAIGLYRRFGFEIVGTRPRYYPSPSPGAPKEDAVIMKRPLAAEGIASTTVPPHHSQR